jgi:hypothetical protein
MEGTRDAHRETMRRDYFSPLVGRRFLLPRGHTVTSLHLGFFLLPGSYLRRGIGIVEKIVSFFPRFCHCVIVSAAITDIS